MSFVPLHLHTEYSLLDGAIRIDALVQRARALNLPALALTDHGNMHGAVEFYQACLKAGIKPILGCEFYVAPGSRLEKKSAHGLSDAAYHLVLLARNLEGYQNLLQLSTIGYLQGFYYRPRIDKEMLAKHSGGLIGLSACLSGEIPRLLQKGEVPLARQAVQEYQQILGRENFFLEIQDHGLELERAVSRQLAALSPETGAPLVATNDSHYLMPEDAEAHEVMLCIQTGSHMDDPGHMRFEGSGYHLKGAEEMEAAFAWAPGAVARSVEIAGRCNLDLPTGKLLMPGFDAPGGANARLEELCRQGLPSRYPLVSEEVEARLKRELQVIETAGFAGYFLIVWDFIRFARSRDIPVGPGRGSAAGSLVAYLLGITGLDPLRYGLLFERFLNPDRLSPPDIDVDFADTGREEVMAYVMEKYGREKVAQIITFGTMAARGAIRDVGRALNMSYGEVDAVARLVAEEPGITLARARELSPDLERLAGEPRTARLLSIAARLEGISRHASIHAAGLVISPDPLIDHVPLCLAKASAGAPASEAGLATQYAMASLEKVGLVKMDFLGLRTLTILKEAVRLVGTQGGPAVALESLPLDDAATFAMLSRGETLGVFQLESRGMRDLIRRFKPQSLEDLNALIALFRPGPMRMIDEFIRRKQGLVPVKYPLPMLEPVLKETYGTIVYQEQVMQIAVAVGGFSLGQADILRRAMSKKNREAIEEQRERFLAGAARRQVPAAEAESLYDLLVQFGEYGFNKSHSAAYALLAYQTAWLKASHPACMLCALLSSETGNHDKVAAAVQECQRLKIRLLPPDLNASGPSFEIEQGAIRFSLPGVKNVGHGMAESIVAARQAEGPFKDLEDFVARVDTHVVNQRAIESLIKAGAMDAFGERAALMERLPGIMASGTRLHEERAGGQGSLFGPAESTPRDPGPASRPWPENVTLANEKEVLGFYLSGHPLAQHEALLKACCTHTLAGLKELKDGQPCVVGGMVLGVKHLVTKRKEAMARFSLEDLEGMGEVLVWPNILAKSAVKPVKDALVLVRGRADLTGDEAKVSAEEIVLLDAIPSGMFHAVHLRVEGLSALQMQGLKELAGGNPGRCELIFHTRVGQQDTVQKAGEAFTVSPGPAFLEGISRLGIEHFWLR